MGLQQEYQQTVYLFFLNAGISGQCIFKDIQFFAYIRGQTFKCYLRRSPLWIWNCTGTSGQRFQRGTDFIALYVSNKTGNSIWSQVFIGNVLLLSIFGMIFGWDYAGYSILFQFVGTKVISTFHHRYDRVTLQITTVQGPKLANKYVEAFRHGISCVDAVGGYSKKKMYLLHTVVSSYEVADIITLFHEVDEHVIVNAFKTQQFFGTFYRAPME